MVESIIDDIPSIFYRNTSVAELIPNKEFEVNELEVKVLSERILDNFYVKPSMILNKEEQIDFQNYFSWRRVADEYMEVYEHGK